MFRISLLLAFGLVCAASFAQTTQQLPFSPARKAGDTLYVSGQIALPPADGGSFTVADETKAIMKKIEAILKQHGYSFDDVVRATVYLRDISDYSEMNSAYGPFFNAPNFPARACVGGQVLVRNCRVEISCIAYKASE